MDVALLEKIPLVSIGRGILALLAVMLFAAPWISDPASLQIITLQKLRIAPAASFSIIDWTAYVIFIVVIGGVGSFEGPIIGTFVFS
jgi:branched-chain amino acid transport system permease protein